MRSQSSLLSDSWLFVFSLKAARGSHRDPESPCVTTLCSFLLPPDVQKSERSPPDSKCRGHAGSTCGGCELVYFCISTLRKSVLMCLPEVWRRHQTRRALEIWSDSREERSLIHMDLIPRREVLLAQHSGPTNQYY